MSNFYFLLLEHLQKTSTSTDQSTRTEYYYGISRKGRENGTWKKRMPKRKRSEGGHRGRGQWEGRESCRKGKFEYRKIQRDSV